MSDTPRTDEFAKRCRDEHPVTGDGRCLEFARQLERELAEAKQEIAFWKSRPFRV